MTSWVIVNRATGEAVCETFSADLAETVRQDKFAAVPIAEYLGNLNRSIKEQPQCSAVALSRRYIALTQGA